MANKEKNIDFDSTNLILFLWKWRVPLIIVSVIAIVASVIFSSPFFITPKFKSTVVLFPTATSSISKILISESYSGKDDILGIGEQEQAEQLLQILNSNIIRSKIIRKYNLMEHYGIDSASRYKQTNLFREYESNITSRRTEYMAVEISVLDKDRQLAADIANDIAALLDSTKNEMQKERARVGLKIVEQGYHKLRDEIRLMEDSLTSLRKLGIHDYESQSEMLNRQLAMELAKGSQVGIRNIEQKLDVLAKYGGPYVSIRDALEHEKKQLSLIKAKYEEVKVDAEQFIPQKFIVDNAYKAEKKSYPVRWLIVVVSMVSVFILAVLVIIIIETINKQGFMKEQST